MPASTPIYGFPYPLGTDPVGQGAQDIKDLATAVETKFVSSDASMGLVKITPTSVTGAGASITSSGSVALTANNSVTINGCFTSQFKQYRVFYLGVSVNTSISNGVIRLCTNGGQNLSSVYFEALNYIQGVPTFNPTRAYLTSQTSWIFHGYGANAAMDCEWVFSNPALATNTTIRSSTQSWANSNNIFTNGFGVFIGSAVFDGFSFSHAGGGTHTGDIKIYGIKD